MCWLSIIVPSYNAEDFIKDLIDSIYLQDNVSKTLFEVIIVNDGSLDKTSTIVSDCQRRYAEMNIVLIEQYNQGASTARNRGLEEACGEFIWFVDADDCIAPNALRDIINVITTHQVDGIRMGIPICQVLQSDGTRIGNYEYKMNPGSYTLQKGYELFDGENGFGHQGFVWRRCFLVERRIEYPENISNNEDFLFLVRALISAGDMYVNGTMRYYLYRELETSLCRGTKTFGKMDNCLHGMIFVLREAVKIKKNARNWNDDMRESYEKRLSKLKFNASVLFSQQSYSFVRCYMNRLGQIECMPFYKEKRLQSAFMLVLNTPVLFIAFSQLFRSNYIMNIAQKIYKFFSMINKVNKIKRSKLGICSSSIAWKGGFRAAA